MASMTTNIELDHKLDKLSGDNAALMIEVLKISSDNAARAERERVVQEKLERLESTVNGNGKEGLKTEVAKLVDKVGTMTTRWNVAMGLLGAQLVALVWGILTHTFRFP